MDIGIEYNTGNISNNNLDDRVKKILKYNSKCYEFKHIKFANGLLSERVDATYIINLKGNGRYKNIMKQLSEYHPTNDVYIVLNEGYKKCDKTKNITYPFDDLTDAFFQIFSHASGKGYDNILVLEDDFIFTNEIKDENHIRNINNFLKRKQGEDFLYYIGCIPWLLIPTVYDINTYINVVSSGTHSVIYSKKSRELLMKRYSMITSEVRDWDLANNFYSKNRYTYYKPLCYQLFESTENSKNWGEGNKVYEFLGDILKSFFKFINLDKSIEPGYTILYVFSKLIFYIFILLFIYFVIKIMNILFTQSKYVITKKK
jgi:hypothetical protein